MPRRIKYNHDESTRMKIRTAQIVNRLQDHFDGKITLTREQIKVADILLKKTLPDLTQVTLEPSKEPFKLKVIWGNE